MVGHLDLLKKHAVAIGESLAHIETPKAARAAEQALEAAKANNSILDLNTAGWRKGLGEPYPAPTSLARWLSSPKQNGIFIECAFFTSQGAG